MTKIIMLDKNDQRTCEVLTKLASREIKVNEAMKLLELGKRQVLRKKAALIKQGIASIPHGNRGKLTGRAVSEADKKHIMDLYEGEYPGWNFTHFAQTIREQAVTSLSCKSISRILNTQGVVSPQVHRRQRKIHPPRQRKESAGELIQVDASQHQWLYQDTSYYHLHGGIDDATGLVVGAYLEVQETIHGYQMILASMIKNYGLPKCWYSDFRTIFASKKTLNLDEELAGKTLQATKFRSLLESLGINLRSTTCPQAKGRIERLWRTFQDRLVKELAKAQIGDLKMANAFIQNQFLPAFNAKFALKINPDKNMFTPVSSDFDCNYHLATYQIKAIHHHCYLKHQNCYLVILNPQTKQPIRLNTREKVKLYTLLDGTRQVMYQGQYFSTRVVSVAQIKTQISPVASATQVKSSLSKPTLSNKPAPNHPWRNYGWHHQQSANFASQY